MKNRLLITALCIALSTAVFAQSKSFATLLDHFDGAENVNAFNVDGFWVDLVMSLSDDDTFNRDAISRIDKIRIITIPKEHFGAKGLSVDGFVKYANRKDAFEELIHVKEGKSKVRVFMRAADRGLNQYLFLVEDEDEVVALEFNGLVDTKVLFRS